MKETWLIIRGLSNYSLDDCRKKNDDLGTVGHVRNVLEQTFKGIKWDKNKGQWTDGHGISIKIVIPEEARVSVLRMEVLSTDDIDIFRHLGGKFRTLARRRFWAVFNELTSEPVLFPPSTRKRHRKFYSLEQLKPVDQTSMPHSSDIRIMYFVEATTDEDIRDILDLVVGTAHSLSPGYDFGAIEEFAIIILENGKRLQGISFKSEFETIVVKGLQHLANKRAIATFCGDELLFLKECSLSSAAHYSCYTY